MQLTFQLDQFLFLRPLSLRRDIRVPIPNLSVGVTHFKILPVQSHLLISFCTFKASKAYIIDDTLKPSGINLEGDKPLQHRLQQNSQLVTETASADTNTFATIPQAEGEFGHFGVISVFSDRIAEKITEKTSEHSVSRRVVQDRSDRQL